MPNFKHMQYHQTEQGDKYAHATEASFEQAREPLKNFVVQSHADSRGDKRDEASKWIVGVKHA